MCSDRSGRPIIDVTIILNLNRIYSVPLWPQPLIPNPTPFQTASQPFLYSFSTELRSPKSPRNRKRKLSCVSTPRKAKSCMILANMGSVRVFSLCVLVVRSPISGSVPIESIKEIRTGPDAEYYCIHFGFSRDAVDRVRTFIRPSQRLQFLFSGSRLCMYCIARTGPSISLRRPKM